MRNRVESRLDKKRYQHTLGVVETADKLAQIHGVDREQARLAGLLHDYAKSIRGQAVLDVLMDFDVEPEPMFYEHPDLAHGFAAALMAQQEFGVRDEAVLNAIRFHTYGRHDMTPLDQVIYLADYTEPNRDFEGVDKMRKLSVENMDQAMLMALEETIVYLLGTDKLIHPDTIFERNRLVKKLKRSDVVSGTKR